MEWDQQVRACPFCADVVVKGWVLFRFSFVVEVMFDLGGRDVLVVCDLFLKEFASFHCGK